MNVRKYRIIVIGTAVALLLLSNRKKDMLNLKIIRTKHTGYTEGCLYANGQYLCDTLEDEVRATKVAGKTAIPAGTYTVAITWSPKFKQYMPLVEDVPGFSGIRIHSGSTVDDTSGCILVGRKDSTAHLAQSKLTYQKLYQTLSKYKSIQLTIV